VSLSDLEYSYCARIVYHLIANLLQVPQYASTKADSASPKIAEKERAFSDSRSSITESLPLHCLSNTLTNLASVHATLMVVKLVPSLLEELHFLLQLLSLEPAFSGASPGGSKCALNSIAELKQEKEPLFANGDDCAGYATLVLEQAGRILDCGKSLAAPWIFAYVLLTVVSVHSCKRLEYVHH
jgi:hypothetical protein